MEFDRIYSKVNKRGGIVSTTYTFIYKDTIITLTENNIHIECSYRIDKKKDIKDILEYLYDNYKDKCKVLQNRDIKSLTNEWIAHNNLYKLHLWRNHTISVDLDYPQESYISLIYRILSIIVL